MIDGPHASRAPNTGTAVTGSRPACAAKARRVTSIGAFSGYRLGMEEREKFDATDVEPDDATPDDDVEIPEPLEPDPEHVVEEKGDES